jgi:coproporphyrinogen III oxidase-like Fe-S oxidoreductase
MKIASDSEFKFDSFVPVYNWIYPISFHNGISISPGETSSILSVIASNEIASRALYFHVPFCETICTFCPFVRSTFHDEEIIHAYALALIAEIENSSSRLKTNDVKIDAIFFGGGTPSLLLPKDMIAIGRTIEKCFDLSKLREFSFEFELKSINEDICSAAQSAGVTHARFGLQTFDQFYREVFNLTSDIKTIDSKVRILSKYFDYISCDILYGMNGQTQDQLLHDLSSYLDLGLKNLDLYPINNLMTQRKLHSKFRALGMPPRSSLDKHRLSVAARSFLNAHGYKNHNGHGYVWVDGSVAENTPTTDLYSFAYHEHVYGYENYDMLGFGVNAISSTQGLTKINQSSRSKYISEVRSHGMPSCSISPHDHRIDSARPLSLRLPYHGACDPSLVDWENLPIECVDAYEQLLDAGMLENTGDLIRTSDLGHEYYSNLMYFMLPNREKSSIDSLVASARRNRGREIEGSYVAA